MVEVAGHRADHPGRPRAAGDGLRQPGAEPARGASASSATSAATPRRAPTRSAAMRPACPRCSPPAICGAASRSSSGRSAKAGRQRVRSTSSSWVRATCLAEPHEPPGRFQGEYRSAQHEGCRMTEPHATAAASVPSADDLLVEIDHVVFGYDPSRTILNDVSLAFGRGKVTAILGGSGCGKTTLLRLIGGVYRAQQRHGHVRRPGRRRARRREAVRAAAQARHAVPVRGAVHRSVGVRQRRLPVARAHRPRRGDDSRHRAHEAQRRRLARRGRPADRGGLRRHGAPRRARARDRARPGAHPLRRAVRRARPDLDGRSPPT